MSAVRDLQRALDAFDKPTLRLLNQTHAPYVLAVFSALLPAEQTRMQADLFHVKVDATLEELRRHDPNTPDASGRDLCRKWVNDAWLWRASNDAGEEEYGLTSYSQEALEYVNRLSGQRSVFGESRIRTILDAAQRCATAANPDPTERLRRLEAQKGEIEAEIARLEAGGGLDAASDDQMMDEYLNLAGLLGALPSDFLRVGEAVKTIHRSIVTELRAESSSPGEVLDGYLARADDLMSERLEGRAFRGAVELLRDERLLAELRSDLISILSHPFAEALLPSEREALRQTVSGVRRGIDTVLAERRRLSASLARHIRRYDIVRDRELDDVLRSVEEQLVTWTARARPRERIPVELPVGRVDVGHLRERTYDPTVHAPPAPLRRRQVAGGDQWRKAREQGGPDLLRLRAHLDAADRTSSLGQVFATLPEDLRRPVEILGLLHVAAGAWGAVEADVSEVEQFRTRRPDGTERLFVGPMLRRGVPRQPTADLSDAGGSAVQGAAAHAAGTATGSDAKLVGEQR